MGLEAIVGIPLLMAFRKERSVYVGERLLHGKINLRRFLFFLFFSPNKPGCFTAVGGRTSWNLPVGAAQEAKQKTKKKVDFFISLFHYYIYCIYTVYIFLCPRSLPITPYLGSTAEVQTLFHDFSIVNSFIEPSDSTGSCYYRSKCTAVSIL